MREPGGWMEGGRTPKGQEAPGTSQQLGWWHRQGQIWAKYQHLLLGTSLFSPKSLPATSSQGDLNIYLQAVCVA